MDLKTQEGIDINYTSCFISIASLPLCINPQHDQTYCHSTQWEAVATCETLNHFTVTALSCYCWQQAANSAVSGVFFLEVAIWMTESVTMTVASAHRRRHFPSEKLSELNEGRIRERKRFNTHLDQCQVFQIEPEEMISERRGGEMCELRVWCSAHTSTKAR